MGFFGGGEAECDASLPPVVNAGWGRFTLERHCHWIHIKSQALTKANKRKKTLQTKCKLHARKKKDWAPMFVSGIFPCLTRYEKTFLRPFILLFVSLEGCSQEKEEANVLQVKKKSKHDVMRVWGAIQTRTSSRKTTWCKHRSN